MTDRAESAGGSATTREGGPGDASEEWRARLNAAAATPAALCAYAADRSVASQALALLAVDRARLAAIPELAAIIYLNPRASLSTANRVVATCHAAGIVPDGIPAFGELAAAIATDPAALDGEVIDGGFAALVAEAALAVSSDSASAPEVDDDVSMSAAAVVANSAEAPESSTSSMGPAPSPRRTQGRRSAIIDFSKLKLYEKIRLATLGNAYCRQNLLRDANRMVALAVIRSPQITDGEIVKAAGNRTLNDEVIRYIANRKELLKLYPVKLALVGNPKCPLAIALRLLSTLNADDIKQFARSKNIPGALSVAAKRLAAAKGPQ